MPKSKVRKKNDFTISPVSRTPVKVKAGPSSTWFVVFFIGLMLIGLVWLLVFQLGVVRHPVHGGPRPMELCDRFCFHDHRSVAHDALALSGTTSGMNLSSSPRVTRISNLAVIGSHGCDSSPLGIALVDNPIGHGKRVLSTSAAN